MDGTSWEFQLSVDLHRFSGVTDIDTYLEEDSKWNPWRYERKDAGAESDSEPDSTPSVFLSHSWADKFFVRNLADRLKASGVRVWLDGAELNVGDSLITRIGRAIDEAQFVAVVLSHNSIGSEWVQTELRQALNKELASREVVVLPILLEKVELPPFLRDKVYADFTDPTRFEESFRLLLRAFGIEAATVVPPPTPPPTVTRMSDAERQRRRASVWGAESPSELSGSPPRPTTISRR